MAEERLAAAFGRVLVKIGANNADGRNRVSTVSRTAAVRRCPPAQAASWLRRSRPFWPHLPDTITDINAARLIERFDGIYRMPLKEGAAAHKPDEGFARRHLPDGQASRRAGQNMATALAGSGRVPRN